ncbi:hypothetical protein [Sphingobium terrigena]|uniref:hypothetical protein n=1 Tax=Sphingobium terrigena TaxID=2304063 RepID=UPI001601EF10|nr:hypothetical protein [Sphingobium terrigena]
MGLPMDGFFACREDQSIGAIAFTLSSNHPMPHKCVERLIGIDQALGQDPTVPIS